MEAESRDKVYGKRLETSSDVSTAHAVPQKPCRMLLPYENSDSCAGKTEMAKVPDTEKRGGHATGLARTAIRAEFLEELGQASAC